MIWFLPRYFIFAKKTKGEKASPEPNRYPHLTLRGGRIKEQPL